MPATTPRVGDPRPPLERVLVLSPRPRCPCAFPLLLPRARDEQRRAERRRRRADHPSLSRPVSTPQSRFASPRNSAASPRARPSLSPAESARRRAMAATATSRAPSRRSPALPLSPSPATPNSCAAPLRATARRGCPLPG
ncbi:hypothetical protein PVAP13_9NG835780 [Panicum virgatum]|uniref:Uncharacterized protein n=1 Tax=Panicum virgatum TaxID=38727 RepID=A0A8T0N7H2_PANVG|nr:hypothetical protein PVAP13_9NG835780 [Panicum virgatum]